jgi:hypothetical protein
MWKFLLSIFVLQLTENGGYVETAQLSTIHQVTEEGDGFINQIVILEPDNTSQIEWNKLIDDNWEGFFTFKTFTLHPNFGSHEVKFHLKRYRDSLLLYGGYHDDLKDDEDFMSQITLTLNLTLHLIDGTVLQLQQTKLVEMQNTDNYIFRFSAFPWHKVSNTSKLPTGFMVLEPIKPVDVYIRHGMRPLYPTVDGDFPPINWNHIKTLFNYEHEWLRMIQGYKKARLHCPVLMLPRSFNGNPFVLFVRRANNSLLLHGGYHETVDNDTKPTEVMLHLTLKLTKSDNSVLELEQESIVVIRHRDTDNLFHYLFLFADIPWANLSTHVAPSALVIMTPVKPYDRFRWLGLSPLIPSTCGEYAPLNWNKITGRYDYKQSWKKIVNNEKLARLHFPPLVLHRQFGGQGAVFLLKRKEENITIYGGYHKNVSESFQPIIVTLAIDLQFTKPDQTQFVLREERVVTLKHLHNNTGFYWLLSFTNIPWKRLCKYTAPSATISIFEPKPIFGEWTEWSEYSPCDPKTGIQMRTRKCHDRKETETIVYCPGEDTQSKVCKDGLYVHYGLPSQTISPNGSYPPAYMGSFKNLKVDLYDRWKKVVKREWPTEFPFPPFILHHKLGSKGVVLNIKSYDTSMFIYGGYHKSTSKSAPAIDVTLSLEITMPMSDQTVSLFKQKKIVTFKRGDNHLITFRNVPWHNISTTKLPHIVVAMKPVKPSDYYIRHGLSLLLLNPCGTYPAVDWSAIKAYMNYDYEWSLIVKGSPKVRLHFPNLFLHCRLDSLSIVLFIRRSKEKLLVYGGYHEDISKTIKPIRVTLTLKLRVVKEDGTWIKMEQMNVVTIKHGYGDNIFPYLLIFNDISWSNLSASNAPQAIVSVMPEKPSDKYSNYGLAPYHPSSCGDYPAINWNSLIAQFNYQKAWKNIVSGSAHSVLHFPAFLLIAELGSEAVAFLAERRGDNLTIFGGYHRNVPDVVPPIDINLVVDLQLIKKDKGRLHLRAETIAKMNHSRQGSHPDALITFNNIPWDVIYEFGAPVALVAITSTKDYAWDRHHEYAVYQGDPSSSRFTPPLGRHAKRTIHPLAIAAPPASPKCDTQLIIVGEIPGTFTSPNYPHHYNPNADCKWIFLPNQPNRTITFEVIDFQLEDTSTCVSDYLTLDASGLQGASFLVNNADSRSRLCSNTVMSRGTTIDIHPPWLQSQPVLRFVSDASIQKRGFSISYKLKT